MNDIITFQDLQQVPDTDRDRAEFVREGIKEHKSGEPYQTAVIADEYKRCRNRTIMQYEKTLHTVTGETIRDEWSPNHKSTSNFFNIFVTQLNQFLLANGVQWKDADTKKKLGPDFDTRLQQIGLAALCGGVSFGFFNHDHLEVFSLTEFVPLYDEESGALAAGVRFWQIDETRPLRATLYEIDGYTDYLFTTKKRQISGHLLGGLPWDELGDNMYARPKHAYRIKIRKSESTGVEICNGENYPLFPIVPMWGNPNRQSELIGLREKIDAYDFILNGYENDLDNAQLFWIIKGAGGMDDTDLAQFLDRVRAVQAVAPADGQEVEPMQINVPYQAREQLLARIEKQLYRDAMIMNPADIAGGAATATQIRAAYEPQNVKTDQYEYCLIDFLHGILKVAGLDDEPTFTRSMIVNAQEEIQTLVTAASYLGREYVTRKVLTLLGDGDKADEVIAQIDAEDAERLGNMETEGTEYGRKYDYPG